ncbi:chemotaxis protein CheW [Halorarum salinum]|uniref:Purine-binding chemotaxis protein CheW n=1 Tax=Halorarum salinum TaxID=2743089 RepID=A0A7D5L8V0_9EURY|nr:chemotaxis protein CheW [Halobaculum salinum]QLG60752.1 purine-binding chemotaxis protein CheW [Halobaculum salinum]
MASSEHGADESAAGASADEGEITQVLEFGLGEETYCLDIAYIDEIVDAGDLTAIPNSPRHVEGVMDLRGKTTTIIDPKTLLGIDGEGPRERIIVFDPAETDDGGTVGWVVDEVFQVRDVAPDEVDEGTTAGDDDVRGIVKGEDRFVVWVEPRTE